MALSAGLASILATANCTDEKLKAFLVENGVTEPDSFGLLASSESVLEAKVFPMLSPIAEQHGEPTGTFFASIALPQPTHAGRGVRLPSL